MKQILTQVHIQAPAEKAWSVLMDFDQYPNWNPFIQSISGNPGVGEQLEAHIQPPEGNKMVFKPTVLNLDPQKEFRWKGKLLIKGIFDGEHYFQLTEKEGGTQFVHGEDFSGLLVPLFGSVFEKTERGFVAMNEALKKRCEE